MLGDDLLRQGILRVNQLELQQQAFLQIARAHAGRIEFLHHGERFFHIVHRVVARSRQFIERRGQVAVFVQVADDPIGDFSHRFGADADAELPGQMVGQILRGRKELIEGRTLNVFAFAAGGALGSGIEILRKEGAKIEFIEGIGFGLLRNFFDFFLEKGLVGIAILRRRVAFGHFIENRVRHDLLIDHLPQFQAVQRQHADHLNEPRRQNLLLRDAETQFGCEPVHSLQFNRNPSPR